MPLYEFECAECGAAEEIIASMKDAPGECVCPSCKVSMVRVYSFASGNKEYANPLVSQSLAINPGQAAEHRKNFPGIELKNDQFPVFHNYQEHDKYLEKTGFIKQKSKHSKLRNKHGVIKKQTTTPSVGGGSTKRGND